MDSSAKLASYPFVIVRIGCELCRRNGEYRLARLAAKYGATIDMDDLLSRLTVDCPAAANARHPYRSAEPPASSILIRHAGRRRAGDGYAAGAEPETMRYEAATVLTPAFRGLARGR